jgi:ferritin-like metal-binding protein YciE
MTNTLTDFDALDEETDKPMEMGLADLFEHALRDIYYAEQEIYRSLADMIRAVQDPALKESLSTHREETAEQIELLEEIFEDIGEEPEADTCDAIDGILGEASTLIEDFKESPALDAAIVFSAQAVEHYEITRYGSMRAYAMALGMDRVAERLSYILDQEKAADEALTMHAEGRVNAAA